MIWGPISQKEFVSTAYTQIANSASALFLQMIVTRNIQL